MNIYKKLMKLPILKKILIILSLLLIIIIFINIKFKKEGFTTNKKGYDIKRGNAIFDPTYVSIYDNLVYNAAKNDYEIKQTLSLDGPKNKLIYWI